VHYKGQLQQRMDSQMWPPTPVAQAEALQKLLVDL
jgi:hypothetical protein